MAAMAHLRCPPLSSHCCFLMASTISTSSSFTTSPNPHLPSLSQFSKNQFLNPHHASKFKIGRRGGVGIISSVGGSGGGGGGGGGGGDGYGGGGEDSDGSKSFWDGFGPIGGFLKGWRERVEADPQFPFKVLMEELVGVSACIVGDMASRPNFGVNELDFVFSTMVVGSILNILLMYILAPTSSSLSLGPSLPSIFSHCPASHMFEPGAFSLLDRAGTFVYKGALFAAAGFGAGLVGTAISTGLIMMRKKMDPEFETPNKPPPTLLNAFAWSVQLGVSSNLRYQTLNGVESLFAKGLPPFAFKTSVVVLRCFNNVLGGMSFVAVARLTGSQVVGGGKANAASASASAS